MSSQILVVVDTQVSTYQNNTSPQREDHDNSDGLFFNQIIFHYIFRCCVQAKHITENPKHLLYSYLWCKWSRHCCQWLWSHRALWWQWRVNISYCILLHSICIFHTVNYITVSAYISLKVSQIVSFSVSTSCVFNSICTVTGFTIIDFPGRVHFVPDRCGYILLKSTPISGLQVLGVFQERRRKDVSFLERVIIKMESTGAQISLEQGGRVLVRFLKKLKMVNTELN